MTTETPSPTDEALKPGYWIDPVSGAHRSIPWPGDRRLPWNHPDRLALLPLSLGPGMIRFAERWFINPVTGLPWRYTAGQKMFIVLAYSVNEDTGRWFYRSAVKRGAKGTGKDPFAASICNLELMGPTRIGRNEDGQIIGIRHRMPLVQIAANSEAQAKDLLLFANGMLPQETREQFRLDCGDTRTKFFDDPGRMELLTASQKTAEGDPATHIALNESHHMTETNGGHAVAEVARRNVGKSPRDLQARLFEYTNAHISGGDSEAEKSYLAWQKQQLPTAKRRDILYDSIEAPPETDLYDDESRARGIAAAYSDAPWSDQERTGDEILDERTSVANAIRFYLNGLAEAEDAWIEPSKFDALSRPGVKVEDGERITMFLDCSKSEDATGLVACRLSDGHTLTLGLWQRPHGDRGKTWLAPREQVDAVVRDAFARYKVVWFGVDPSPARDDEDEALYWAPMIDGWHRDFRRKLPIWATPGATLGNSVKFDMRLSQRGAVDRNRDFTEMAELLALIIDEDPDPDHPNKPPGMTHDGHPGLRMHTHNAKLRPNKWGHSLGKKNRDSKQLVDLAVCMVGAHLGRRIALNSGKFRSGSSTEKRKAVLA